MKYLALLILLLLLVVPIVANAQDSDEPTDPTPPVEAGEGDNTVPDDWFDLFLESAFVLSIAVAGAIETVWKPLVKPFIGRLEIPRERQVLFNKLIVLGGAIVLTLYFVVIQDGNLLSDTGNTYLENIGEAGQLLLTSAFVMAFAVFGAEVYAYVRRLAKAV